MLCGIHTEAGVPKAEREFREAMWTANGATSVSSKADGDGTYTITAVFPPCPEDASPDKKKNKKNKSSGD